MTKILFIKGAAAVGYAYHEGDVAELPEKAAADLKRLKYAKDYVPEKKEVQTDLPEDFPGRDKLIEAGFLLISDVKGVEDITQVNGIGPVLSKQIKEYLEKMGSE